MPKSGYDFCGWATRNDLKCADGRTIRKGAFEAQDGEKVPLFWNHQHNDLEDVLGHAILENREDGVYAYGYFNNSEKGQNAKERVRHGDVTSMSIWANRLQQNGSDVLHGVIREVSLVVAGANPGAYIESVVAHGEPMDDYDDECILYTGEDLILSHAENARTNKQDATENKKEGETTVADDKEKQDKKNKTVQDVIDSMTEEQKNVLYAMVGYAYEDNDEKSEDNEEEEKGMKHNIFSDGETEEKDEYISHSDMEKIFSDARRIGSLREAVNQNTDGGVIIHAIDDGMIKPTPGTETYGFKSPSMFYPDAKAINTVPEFISRDTSWVSDVINSVHHTPFSRVKSMYANITEEEARARGYLKKGTAKKYEVFSTLKRVTNPTTIYKLQKMDRDDILDITDFDVVAWIRQEMQVMLYEEIARAILIGDGRRAGTDEKISEECIRPIAKDVELFNTKVDLEFAPEAKPADTARMLIDQIIRAHKKYKGSGNPTLYTTDEWLTEMLLLEDTTGHKLYKSEAELATTLRVGKIVTVEPMEGQKADEEGNKDLIGVIVNLKDYNIGRDPKAGISMFDDFDIDFNQYKYLIETRMSGALVKPYSAITITGKVQE